MEFNHFLARFNEKMNIQNVSARATQIRMFFFWSHLGRTCFRPESVKIHVFKISHTLHTTKAESVFNLVLVHNLLMKSPLRQNLKAKHHWCNPYLATFAFS